MVVAGAVIIVLVLPRKVFLPYHVTFKHPSTDAQRLQRLKQLVSISLSQASASLHHDGRPTPSS